MKKTLTILLVLCLMFTSLFSLPVFAEGETIILNAANEAVLNVLHKNDIKYSDISIISRDDSGAITGIEINIEKVNLLKSSLSNEISRIVSAKNKYDLNIPIGSLFGSEYTLIISPFSYILIVIFLSSFAHPKQNNVIIKIIIIFFILLHLMLILPS